MRLGTNDTDKQQQKRDFLNDRIVATNQRAKEQRSEDNFDLSSSGSSGIVDVAQNEKGQIVVDGKLQKT